MCATGLSFGYLRWGKQSESHAPSGWGAASKPVAHLGIASVRVAGRVLGHSLQSTSVVACGLGSEASVDTVTVPVSVILCEEEGLILQTVGGSLSSAGGLDPD